jgi:SAM-dependent methyltransferase
VHLRPEEIAERASNAYADLCARFRADGEPVDFDFRKHCVQWTARGDHLTHRLHRYPGRLTPYIPLFFLGVRGVAVSGGSLLDPFAGCGTVLVEAPVHPAHPMRPIGIEINPLARLIAKVKTTSLDPRSVADAWKRIRARHDTDVSRAGLSTFPNKRHWFTLAVERRLARVMRSLEGLRDQDLRDFFLVAASSVVRDVALADPSVSVPVRIDPRRFHDPAVRARARNSLRTRMDADVVAIFDRTVARNLARLTSWVTAKSSLVSEPAIVGEDARTFEAGAYVGRGELAKESSTISGVDLVLTSPPYANAQRYTRSLRLELFVLGYTNNSATERALDCLQVGTERVPFCDWKAMIEATNSTTANTVIAKVHKKDPYRAAIVGKYVRDMETVLSNCYRALKAGGHAVFVIGNNSVRGRLVDNAEVLAELGARAGFVQTARVRNRIPSRGLLTKRHPTAGVITHEHVVVLRKPTTTQARP